MRSIFLIFMLFLTSPATAAPQILADCHLGKGHSFFEPSSLIPQKEAGWQNDGWSNAAARVVFMRDGDKLDLIVRDAVGTKSVVEDGGRVIRLPTNNSADLLFTTIYLETGTVETYLVVAKKSGPSKLLWTSVRSGGNILGPKIGSYVGMCG